MTTAPAENFTNEQLFTLFREQIDRDDNLLRELVAVRKHLGISQAQLAHLMETNQGYISRLENGSLNPRARTLREYAVALGVEIHYTLKPFLSKQEGHEVEFLDDSSLGVATHITATPYSEGPLSWQS